MTAARPIVEILDEVESLLRARARLRLDHPSAEAAASADPRLDEQIELAMAALDEALAASPADAAGRATARRVERVRALHGLQTRPLPDEALDGLYDDIRSGVTAGMGAPWVRAGMSGTFLDAPHSLVIWRRTAMAACLLLAVGTGFFFGDAYLPATERGGTGADPRDRLLRPAGVGDATRVTPASSRGDMRFAPVRGGTGFVTFGRPDASDIDAGRMLDGVRIFPVPGPNAVPDATVKVEQN